MDRTGEIILPWGKVWYRKAGKPKGLPLLVLHGGPGYPSDYLWNLDKLGSERAVIFYDQSGCGRSVRELDRALRTVEHFTGELRAVLQQLQVDGFHLLGHSWGTIIAAEHLFKDPAGARSVIFASPCFSIPLWLEAANRHLDELPSPLGQIIRRYEQDDKTGAPEYKHAQNLYHTTYECRLQPPPQGVMAANRGFGINIYRFMWGPNEYTITGSLNGYDCSEKLSSISIPTLFTCGKYDSASPEACQFYKAKIPNAGLQVFGSSSHMPHLEEEDLYIETLRNFLKLND